jgi:hypothetical protein
LKAAPEKHKKNTLRSATEQKTYEKSLISMTNKDEFNKTHKKTCVGAADGGLASFSFPVLSISLLTIIIYNPPTIP